MFPVPCGTSDELVPRDSTLDLTPLDLTLDRTRLESNRRVSLIVQRGPRCLSISLFLPAPFSTGDSRVADEYRRGSGIRLFSGANIASALLPPSRSSHDLT